MYGRNDYTSFIRFVCFEALKAAMFPGFHVLLAWIVYSTELYRVFYFYRVLTVLRSAAVLTVCGCGSSSCLLDNGQAAEVRYDRQCLG